MHRTRRRLSLIAFGIAVVGWCASSGCGSGAGEPPTKYGLHQDLTYDGWKWRRRLAIDRARDVKAQISRNSLLWHQIEATPGHRDWRLTDTVLDELAAAGIEPLLVIVGSPGWANRAPASSSRPELYVPPRGHGFDAWLASYRRFVRAAVRRYRGRVHRWELWNEENGHHFWKPGPDVDQYARFFRELRRTILKVDPGAEVAVGGLAGITAGDDINGLRFLKGLMGKGLEIDHVALHPYPSDGHAPGVHRPRRDNFDDIAVVHDYLRKVRSDAAIWVTEWGWSSATLGTETQARYVKTSLRMISERYPYVELATYFVDYDRPPDYHHGLFDTHLDPKPSARSFAGFMRALDGGAG